jgi:peptidoglycan/xylan/chitin deacetylase (PgdA/CDA1 family)
VSVQRLTRQVREVWEVPRDLLLRRYPPFVTGGPLPRGHVPVFVFHSVEPDSFGRKLQYLADNDYRTLTAQEYMGVLTRGATPPERAVVLTFDDGRASLAGVGAPLLRKHGMTGIVFLVPGRTPASAASSAAGPADTALLTWDQVRSLSASGTFDFQSHTLHHSRIHVAPRVAGFMTPWMRSGYPAFDVPLVEQAGRDLLAHDVPLGTPLLESAPRTSEALRFHEDPSPRQACVEAVADAGGEAFFERPGWERELRRIAAGGARIWGGRLETDADREQAIRRELVEARALIERHTGKPAVHLCYPWHASGPTARRLAREAGYLTAFSGKVPGVPITAPGGDPQSIARIGEDYVELLPGRGRTTLKAVLQDKWRRRRRAAS